MPVLSAVRASQATSNTNTQKREWLTRTQLINRFDEESADQIIAVKRQQGAWRANSE